MEIEIEHRTNKVKLPQSSKRTKLIIAWVFGLLLFTPWYNDNDSNDILQAQKNNSPIVFNISIQANAITDAGFKTSFEEGDEIGVFAVKRTANDISAILQPSDNYIHNAKLIYNGTTWTGDVYYPNDEDVLDFYAYYPYDSNNIDPTEMTFNVYTDQSTAMNFSKSDLMTAKANDISKKMTVFLNFSHRLSMVQVKVKEGDGFSSFDKAFNIELKNVATKVSFDWDAVTIPMASNDINMYPVFNMPNTYCALVPEQTIAQGIELLGFSRENSPKFIDYVSEKEMELVKGKTTFIHNVTMEVIDPNHIYAIGDVYPYKGQPKGIVYEVSNGGKNGLVVSLDQSEPLMWCGYKEPVGIPYTNSGMWNMHILQSHIDKNEEVTWDKFPAFSWVHKKNKLNVKYDDNAIETWFLPAIDELINLYNVYKTDEFGFDKKLTEVGGSPILLYKTYWSSTENCGDKAATVYFGTGSVFYDFKALNYSTRVRCILVF